MIVVRGLTKHFQTHRRPPGVWAALRSVVSRSYQTVKAVDGIDFSIRPGERVGFLGPNGAGKTTTLKMLSGLLHPTSGDLEVFGFRPQRREEAFLKSIMLVMGQKQQLIWDLPPSETFELNRGLYDVPRALFRERLAELIELLKIGDVIHKPTRQLSLGERMKCELAASLVYGPKTLFLDEPTIGLDVSMQVAMRDFIRRYNEQHGATLILTSHYMEDVVALCPRIIVIDQGKLMWDGSIEELARQVKPEKRLTLGFSRDVDRADIERLGKVVSFEGRTAVLQVSQGAVSQAVSAALASLPVDDVTAENAPLEEVLREMFERRAPAAVGSPP